MLLPLHQEELEARRSDGGGICRAHEARMQEDLHDIVRYISSLPCLYQAVQNALATEIMGRYHPVIAHAQLLSLSHTHTPPTVYPHTRPERTRLVHVCLLRDGPGWPRGRPCTSETKSETLPLPCLLHTLFLRQHFENNSSQRR